jgi:NAD-dependent dihydropyrimidine dehydrogenase PreA subunit
MTHIITGLCQRHGGCVEKCPVDCIVAGQPVGKWPFYYIDPDTCIDCGACVPACPYSAIFPEADVPVWLAADIRPNYDFFEKGPGYNAQRL